MALLAPEVEGAAWALGRLRLCFRMWTVCPRGKQVENRGED